MQKLFLDSRKLDSLCVDSYGLTEEIMMENAASSLDSVIREKVKKGSKIIILCGSGNNGADGYALSRKLVIDFDVRVYKCYEPSGNMCIMQYQRAEKTSVPCININELNKEIILNSDIIVDCIFGSGFHGDLSGENLSKIQETLINCNNSNSFKIACDVPTGIRMDGTISDYAFCADMTVSMGALKLSLFSDVAKDYIGDVKCVNLGISRELFEKVSTTPYYLLDKTDLVLPFRKKRFVNKGSFGYVYVACGEKIGAGCIAASAALRFGAGLVTLIRPEISFSKVDVPDLSAEILTSFEFSERVDAVAVGMGLGHEENNIKYYFDYLIKNQNVNCILDADVCYSKNLKNFLNKREKGCILTPHPKEFSSLLKVCDIGEYSIQDCVNYRPMLIEKFCKKYPNTVLLVKGANPMIGIFTEAEGFSLFVNNLGQPSLAKAGSGDVLSGMICALLAQGYTPLNAAISGSLAHALASHSFKNDYALTPYSLIQAVADL